MKFLFSNFADSTNLKSQSAILRKKRFELFLNNLQITNKSKILDVGGTEGIWLGTGLENQVTLFNIAFKSEKLNSFAYVIGDACKMNFTDKEFDIVFSNSVIEHVGNIERQTMYANEIKRVGKKYWVQTPYKHFPIEPHFLFPFFQYFPSPIKRIIGTSITFHRYLYN